MRESIKMEKSNGFLDHTTPVHKTNNLLLRWFANNVSSPISHKFLILGLGIYFRDEDKIVPMTPALKRRMSLYIKLEHFFGRPYYRWGTSYKLDLDAMKLDLSGPGWDDYDEDNVAYWAKWNEENN